jgi:hypothetical protein
MQLSDMDPGYVAEIIRRYCLEPLFAPMQRVAAAAAGLSEEIADNLLPADNEVRFSRGRSGDITVGLRCRVGQG